MDLNAPDARGLRPIHLAALGGLAESVVAFVEAGVPVDSLGTGGNTALHLAAYHRRDGVVAVLMRAGEALYSCIFFFGYMSARDFCLVAWLGEVRTSNDLLFRRARAPFFSMKVLVEDLRTLGTVFKCPADERQTDPHNNL